ncbi:DUF4232 domain-containing protein [Streptomyces sp. NPDC051173]|uniref:DUF4232 domain-containing protein n=1 Tax=Streptomyces sp. NPDC051173 TaxID=3155164 RepID=UPI00344BB3DC
MKPATHEATRTSRKPLVQLAGLLTAGLLTACGAPSPVEETMEETETSRLPGERPSPEAMSGAPDVLDCPASGLIAQAGEANAAMGLRVLSVKLTNCGKEPKVVKGYPDIQVLDGDRKPVEVELERGAASVLGQDDFDAGPTEVTLTPGQWALARLAWRNTVDSLDRAPVTGAYLSLAPVPGSARQNVPETIDLGTTGKLGLSAWAAPTSRDGVIRMDG